MNAARQSPFEHDEAVRKVLGHSRTRLVFGAGTLSALGQHVAELGGRRVLLVSDSGLVRAGHVTRAETLIANAGAEVFVFDGVEENPSTEHVAAGVEVARSRGIDFIVGLGGGSSMDCAKGVNFILSNGGKIADYWGVNLASKPMLPFVAVPTTAGTGSEAQSFALITDPATHQKMACGDVKAAARLAILDPDLTVTQPRQVAACTGIDAVSHAVETAASSKRNEISREFSRLAWRRLEPALETAVATPREKWARADMLLGAHLAGAAIEHSMLGAAHACANPLTATYGVTHGIAVGVMLAPTIRFNTRAGDNPYSDLDENAETLAHRVERYLRVGGLPSNLRDCGVDESRLGELAALAAKQWTAQFNPRPVGVGELLELYRMAFG